MRISNRPESGRSKFYGLETGICLFRHLCQLSRSLKGRHNGYDRELQRVMGINDQDNCFFLIFNLYAGRLYDTSG